MQLHKTASLAIALCSLVGVGDVFADADETRFSVHGNGALLEFSAFEESSDTQLYGGGVAVAHGIRNWLDLGAVASYQLRSDVVIDGATLDGVGGAGYHLYTNLRIIDAALTARSYLEVGPFLRLRPILGVRVGVQVVGYGDPELFLDGSGGQLKTNQGESEWEIAPLLGFEFGAAYRLSDRFEMALIGSGAVSDTMKSFSLAVEFSWQKG